MFQLPNPWNNGAFILKGISELLFKSPSYKQISYYKLESQILKYICYFGRPNELHSPLA